MPQSCEAIGISVFDRFGEALNILLRHFDTAKGGSAPWTPHEILAWSWETFQPEVAASSSFQTQSVALLHMIAQVCPDMPVIFLDTGYHFPETLAFRDRLQEEWGLNVRTVYPDPEARKHLEKPTEPPYRRDPDLCCRINKVEPMNRALSGMKAWVTGIRRDQTSNRRGIEIIERRPDGLIKVHPLANWTKHDLWSYIDRHDLPAHPLFVNGYLSIGCAPCTRRVLAGEGERSGRWAGTDKTECGLHTAVDPMKEDTLTSDSDE